jgi:hypothetical protein
LEHQASAHAFMRRITCSPCQTFDDLFYKSGKPENPYITAA